MIIAIDKNSIGAIKPDNEYIYLFDDEPLEELLKLNIHCINYKYCGFVDINLTKYDLDCFKKATINDKDYDKLPEKKDYKIGIIVRCFSDSFNGAFHIRLPFHSIRRLRGCTASLSGFREQGR